MTTADSTSGSGQRVVALVLLVIVGALSLPVSAAFLDGDSTEDLVVPVQLIVVTLLGALAGYLLPGLGGPASSRRRSALVGVVVGLVSALVSIAWFSLILG